ncbi:MULTISPECIES: DEAD/DEAH box helicase family protein [Bradyrhizobium]|uniref:DEAD/DEAH box helicase family protein n=1 Tax=Bradyrhizobium TaxID=374 RepID=UPI00155F06C5|nr:MULTISPECIES: DEAD/DEAH box helicase family protein [Bradyrhizobium]MDD1520016.1 ATP-dependent helicase [Bradyrhizobium sp. WBAH30]MDD1544260.1 ATP-dependent helicase [Bradyrhizobium sp. WBAH41]MDD1558142.1 ATP-dependent helicase [Bradyrhizobium sp. WBAH23]MDD1565540.1 ATP-dependent helicase [Bradyrhizobium sp. WBAH33]MDD1590670.1 ATP-dependent helicase [Bradyrhizobium sp. WBAH42]
MTEVLRPYQVEVIAEFWRAIDAGQHRIILVAPTASGKTVIARAIIAQAQRKDLGSLFLAHRREILAQTSNKLHGIPHGVIRPGIHPRPLEMVQVASVQTLHRRAIKAGVMELPEAGLVIVDECHHVVAESYQSILDRYPQAILLGLTATPCRGDGRGLGAVFQKMIQCPQVGELVGLGFLVPTRVYAPVDPDLRGVHVRHGDYVESELARRMDQPQLVGDIVTHWFKFGERRRTVCFATDVRHSIHIRDEFGAAGVRAEHIDGETPMAERDATLARLASGEIDLVTNCMVLTEGWDMPALGCLILARPTKQLGLYRQMIGRGLRPAPDKANCIVLDHAGLTYQLGLAEDFIEWTLDPDLHAENPTHAARGGDYPGGPKIAECPQCGAARVGGMACLSCGYLPARLPREVAVADGNLGLVDAGRKARPSLDDPRIRAEWHGMFATIAAERGAKPGWVAHLYHTRFGEWPPYGEQPRPREPSVEVRRWVKSRLIAYARRRKSA